MEHSNYDPGHDCRPAWNAERKLGAKRPLHPNQVWAVRFWLEQEHRLRDRALFDLAIDSKLRGCELVKIRISELVSGGRIRERVIVIQNPGCGISTVLTICEKVSIPFIFVTGNVGDVMRRLPVSYALSKPFSVEQLAAAVTEALK